MQTSDERLQLDNMARGAAIELFDIELKKVLENLDDPNRDVKAVREIHLIVKFTPTETKGLVAVDVQTKKKMPAINGIRTTMVYERDPATDRIKAREFVREHQAELWGEQRPSDKVRAIRPITE